MQFRTESGSHQATHFQAFRSCRGAASNIPEQLCLMRIKLLLTKKVISSRRISPKAPRDYMQTAEFSLTLYYDKAFRLQSPK
jgi:hypothetical protein